MKSSLFTYGNTVTFLLVLILTIASVIYGHIKKKSLNTEGSIIDYLIMGRSLTLPLFVTSLVSTWYGGIFGVTQISFESGIYNFVTQGLFWYITYLIFAFFLVDKIKQYKSVTLADMVKSMFGKRSAKVAAVFNLINVVPIAYTLSMGILLDSIFNIGMTASITVGTLFVLCYSLLGGFRAVIFSDFIQFFVMFISAFMVVVFSIHNYGGVSFLKNNLPSSHFSLTGGNGLGTTLAWGLIALSTLVDPNFYQRVFAAENTQVAKKGILISTGVWVVFDLCTTLGGMYARAVMPEAQPDQAYLLYSIDLLPNIIQGFFIAGILATIVSTLDSYLFLAGSTLAHDLLPSSMNKNIKNYQLSTIFIAVLSIILSHFFEGGIKDVWKLFGSLSASCLLLPIMIGHFYKGYISDNEFLITSALSALVICLWKFIPFLKNTFQIDEIYIGCAVSILSIIICKITPKTPRSKHRNI